MKQFYFLFLVFSAVYAYGQVRLVTEVEDKEYRVNQKLTVTFLLEISGENMVQQTSLRLPDFSKFNIIASGSEQNTLLLERGAVNQIIYQWVISPKLAGELKIGSAIVTVNGKTYKTEPLEINVLEASKTAVAESPFKVRNDLYINLEVADQEIYKNQPTVAILRAYSKNLNNFRKVKDVQFPQQDHVEFSKISNEESDIEAAKNNISSKILGVFLILPNKSGTLEVKPVSARYSSKSIKLLSNRIKLKVKELPGNAPKNFKNAVGAFTINFSLKDAKKVEVNKPAHLILKITGEGNLETLELPVIKETKDFQIFAPKISTNTSNSENGISGDITADYVIIPKKAGSFSVITDHFSYFDPSEERYEDLGSQSLELNAFSNDEMLALRTPLERVNEYTNNVLQTVDNPVLQTKKLQVQKKSEVNWRTSLLNFAIFCGVIGILLLISFYQKKRRKKKDIIITKEGIKKGSERLSVPAAELENTFGYMKRMVREKEFTLFFKTLADLDGTVRNNYKNLYAADFLSNLEREKGPKLTEEYRKISQKIQIEKYAPVTNEEQIKDLLPLIINLYSNIAQ